MTAEIAILNRRAIAFAADSAVTISDGTRDKIYNTQEKLFELSRKVPLGLMVYNSTQFVGVPFDILARRFRAKHDEEFTNAHKAWDSFSEFLTKFTRFPEQENDHFRFILDDEWAEILREHERRFTNHLFKAFEEARSRDATAEFRPEKPANELLVEILEKHQKTHEENPLDGFLTTLTVSQVAERYGAVLDNLKRTQWELDDDAKAAIRRWALAVLRSKVFSDNLSGLVFGGFGKDELFPSLFSVEIDGIFFGQLKWRMTYDIDIDRRGDQSRVVSFAQREMAERFIYGIDDDTEATILKYANSAMTSTLQAIAKHTGLTVGDLGVTSDTFVDNIGQLLQELKNNSEAETIGMVDLMPKQELAYAAESFVSMTSIKRKVSFQQETVGGPIDVVVITANEGFIWIKRKHYFDRELNPGYAVRAFENAGGQK